MTTQLGLRPGRYVVLSVQDTGEGMDSDTLARAVEPLFSTKGIGKGTGVRLSAAVRRCATRRKCFVAGNNRSTLAADCHKNLGAFGRPGERSHQGIAPSAILFVDDDFLIAGSTVAQLQDLGHEVIEAHSAREALQHLEGGCIQTF